MNEILKSLGTIGVIPVVKIDQAELAQSLAQALLSGDLPCIEITFRTSQASQAIRNIIKKFPEMMVGAGTILTIEQAEQAVDAGARFIVSPGFSRKVVDWCLHRELPVLPGVATPSEIMQALDAGLSVMKFFPADILGGAPALKAIGAAFGGVKFVPTGGVSASNLAEYLSLPMVHACGGSWMVKSDLIAAGAFEKITELALEARGIVKRTRTKGAN